MSIEVNDEITITRDCEAILIPMGTPITIPQDSIVIVTQALGGSYTVNVNGNLARVAGKDADALGADESDLAKVKDANEIVGDGTVDMDQVWEQLKTCYDPEIPVDIVELGLIYDCEITPIEEGGNRIDILMTLTAAGCGMGDFIADDVRQKALSVDNITEANVQVTFDPPWDSSMMSDVARLATGMY